MSVPLIEAEEGSELSGVAHTKTTSTTSSMTTPTKKGSVVRCAEKYMAGGREGYYRAPTAEYSHDSALVRDVKMVVLVFWLARGQPEACSLHVSSAASLDTVARLALTTD